MFEPLRNTGRHRPFRGNGHVDQFINHMASRVLSERFDPGKKHVFDGFHASQRDDDLLLDACQKRVLVRGDPFENLLVKSITVHVGKKPRCFMFVF